MKRTASIFLAILLLLMSIPFAQATEVPLNELSTEQLLEGLRTAATSEDTDDGVIGITPKSQAQDYMIVVDLW